MKPFRIVGLIISLSFIVYTIAIVVSNAMHGN